MTFMRWTEEMSVGVPLLDADHRLFVDVINKLDENANFPMRRMAAKNALDTLVRYARYHFDREEAVMAACGYPGIEGHKEEHAAFTVYIGRAVERFDADPNAGLDATLPDFLKSWLTHHILIQDMAYRPFVDGNAAADLAAKAFHPLYVDAL
jgi:hemerythrin